MSSLDAYHAVVIDAPLYMGKVVGDAKRFTWRHRDTLATMPVAAFCVGVTPLLKDPADKDDAMKRYRTCLAPLEPVAKTIFAGKVVLEKLPFFQKMTWKKMNRAVGDFRDWDTIAAQARELPGKVEMLT